MSFDNEVELNGRGGGENMEKFAREVVSLSLYRGWSEVYCLVAKGLFNIVTSSARHSTFQVYIHLLNIIMLDSSTAPLSLNIVERYWRYRSQYIIIIINIRPIFRLSTSWSAVFLFINGHQIVFTHDLLSHSKPPGNIFQSSTFS